MSAYPLLLSDRQPGSARTNTGKPSSTRIEVWAAPSVRVQSLSARDRKGRLLIHHPVQLSLLGSNQQPSPPRWSRRLERWVALVASRYDDVACATFPRRTGEEGTSSGSRNPCSSGSMSTRRGGETWWREGISGVLRCRTTGGRGGVGLRKVGGSAVGVETDEA